MAITQKHKVEFMVTSVLPTEVEQAMREAIKEMRKEYTDGDCFKFSPASVRKVS